MKLLALFLLPVALVFVEFPTGEKFKAGEKITVDTAVGHDSTLQEKPLKSTLPLPET